MKRFTLFFACLFLSIGTALAQQKVVSGIVISAEDNQPVIGASVIAKGFSGVGAQTDIDGKFSFTAPAAAKTIVVTYIGLQTQEVAISANMRIVMKPEAKLLDEVVVVAYGTVRKQSMVGAQSSVSSKQLEKRPITNVSNALGGVAPGVQVLTSSGQPGASAQIRIRGFGSINASSAPLYVVDGAIYNGDISDIAAQDIQSMSILKDAASTSLYGSSAGNGVILITTKSGSRAASGKPKFTFTTNLGASRKGQQNYEKVDAMQYYPLRWQQWFNEQKYVQGKSDEQAAYWANYYVQEDLKYNPYAGISSLLGFDPKTKQWIKTNDPKYPGGAIPLIVMPDGSLNPEVKGLLWGDDMDWEKELFRTGFRQEYVISGGLNTDKMKSYMSLSYLGEDGYKKHTSLERYSSRVNLSYDITKWLTLGTNTSISRTHTEQPKADGGKTSNAFNFMQYIAPIYPIHQHNDDGSYVLDGLGQKQYDYNPLRPYSGRFNPVYEQFLDKKYGDRDAITSRTFAEFNLYEGLKFRTNLAYDLLRKTDKVRFNNIMGDQPQGLLRISNDRYTTITFNQLLEYDTKLSDHHINAMLGHESYEYNRAHSFLSKENMFLLGIDEMPNLLKMTDMSSYTDKHTKEGYFGRVNYDYKDLYNLSLSYRRDGTSRFLNNRWGNFWSTGLGWIVSNENFMKDAKDWMTFLKIRGSIGQTGNDLISTYYAYQTLFGLGNNNFDRIGLRVANLGNPDLKWEKQTSYDLALEFNLFNRFNGTVEFFNKESDDLLFAYDLPASTGVASIDKNIGKIRNQGIEMDFHYDIFKNRDFKWGVSFNGTIFKNKIVRLPEENRKDGIELAYHKYEEGRSINDYYLNEFIGVDPEDGLAIYRIDDVKYPQLADPNNPDFIGMAKEGEKATWTKDGRYVKKHFAGSSIPKMYGGFGTEASYKGFDFSMQFAYQLGGKTYDTGYQGLMGRRLKSGSAMHIDMLNAWKKPGDITNVPRLDATSTNYDNLTSDRFLISSNSLLLKTVSLGYTLPQKWVRPLELSGARFSIVAENLFFLSKRKGLNPMGKYSGIASAIDYGFAKVITANITLSF